VRLSLPLLLVVGLLALLVTSPAQAQRPEGDLGVGVQIGNPVGVTLRTDQAYRSPIEGLVAWDLAGGALFASGHLILFEQPLPLEDGAPAYLFIGPGAYLSAGDDHFDLGASGRAGLSYFIAPLELFVQVSPRFNVLPDTDVGLGGGLGARYYF
jgi:hypothetical protein